MHKIEQIFFLILSTFIFLSNVSANTIIVSLDNLSVKTYMGTTPGNYTETEITVPNYYFNQYLVDLPFDEDKVTYLATSFVFSDGSESKLSREKAYLPNFYGWVYTDTMSAPSATHALVVDWFPPSGNVDESDLRGPLSFEILFGTAPGVYTISKKLTSISFNKQNRLTSKVKIPFKKTIGFYYALITVDNKGLESSPTEAHYISPSPLP